MDKVVEIDLVSECDLFEKYNRKVISSELIDYMVKSVMRLQKNEMFKVVINNEFSSEEVSLLIKKRLEEEYDKNVLKRKRNTWVQIVYLFFGIIALFLSNIIDATIFKEIVLIGGWVLIWTMVEVELFSDIELKRRQKVLEKLLNCEFVENKVSSNYEIL